MISLFTVHSINHFLALVCDNKTVYFKTLRHFISCLSFISDHLYICVYRYMYILYKYMYV